LRYAAELNSQLTVAGEGFSFAKIGSEGWAWHGIEQRIDDLPLPALMGSCQLQNAAAVLQVISLLPDQINIDHQAISWGLQNIALAGRFQRIPGPVELILDVAHNPAAAQVLADSLQKKPCKGRTLAVFAMLADKDVATVVDIMAPHVDVWFLAALNGDRGLSANDLQLQVDTLDRNIQTMTASSVERAYALALEHAIAGDRVVVFGSFFTVSKLLHELGLESGKRETGC
jgi:dihydrofolate synthase/folylpolyglutamate synthase